MGTTSMRDPASDLVGPASASQARYRVPTTVSQIAQDELSRFYAMLADLPQSVAPVFDADWARRHAEVEVFGEITAPAVAEMPIATRDDVLGGIPVVRIVPTDAVPGRTLIYLHGGGYTFFSARSSLLLPALVAAAAKAEVLSVDYTVAPRGMWLIVPDQVIAVYKALLDDGADPSSIGIFGDSAGGALAAGSVLKMRDDGVPLPGALYLVCPWSDIGHGGDTYDTLAEFDPTLTAESLRCGANAYVAPADQRHPYVSPVYGDYDRPFPPTLLQGGTREIFVSSIVRHYQALRAGGKHAELDLYEGMPHVWQVLTPHAPETTTSVHRAAAFLAAHLGWT